MKNPPSTHDKPKVADDTLGFEQLKLLFDYTKFHITAYLTLAGVFVAALNGVLGLSANRSLLGVSIAFIAIAGAAGGVVASNLPYYSDARTFAADKIGPWQLKPMTASRWMSLEHAAFWLALIAAIAAFVAAGHPPSTISSVVQPTRQP